MAQLLGLLLLSFLITSLLLVPFIDLLYKWKLRRQNQETRDVFDKLTPIFDKLHGWKVGTPVGGGLLIILVVTIMTLWSYGLFGFTPKVWEIFLLLFSFISFGLLGLYDDIRKTFGYQRGGFFGLRLRHKLLFQIILALIIGILFYTKLGVDFINIHWFGTVEIGIFYIPLAAFIVVSFANAFNITDGLDGLASGLLLICLTAFWVISSTLLDPTLAVFIAIWIGSLLAFLYFNIYPARIWLGDVGALSFGATLAVVGLLTGKIPAVAIIGGVFVAEVASSFLQLISKKFLGKKVFHVAPLHLWFQNKDWGEPKVVTRFWLIGILFAIFGLWLAVIK
ncbi:phospho-N-acetylmuramoyl-pentapeptide-transferase [Candidatus Gottesmanbacteria bacterium]|nr:phospho-N-acetylmuramoyl-pentapeptide-transferase [Candidatus Gottesmanbacteria bacterium]